MRRPTTSLVSGLLGILATILATCLQVLWMAGTPAGAQTSSWPVYHHDAGRGGVADPGPALSAPTSRWTSPAMDGRVYTEPVVTGSTVIVATENDTVYGLNAVTGAVAWHTHLATAPTLAFIHQQNVGGQFGVNCGDIDPLGVTGTPVIDQGRGEVFVAAEVETGNSTAPIAHQLFGLNVTTGQLMLPATSVDPPGLHPVAEQQRAALALGNGRVYVSYGGLAGDCGQYKGAVDSVTEDGAAAVSWTVPTSREGGIWAPSGPAIAPNGNVYVAVGNSANTNANQGFDGGDSVTELSPTLAPLDFFAPSTWPQDNATDADLGSTGPELLGNGTQVFQVGKSGTAYLLNASKLGSIGGQIGATQVCTSFGGQAYDGTTIYVSCTDGVRAVRVNAAGNGFDIRWHGPGGANGPPILGGGLVWVIGGQTMYGLDPATGVPVTQFGLPSSGPVHFLTPTVADGELLVATGQTVEAYGAATGPATPRPTASSPQFGVPDQTDVFDVNSSGAIEVSWVQGAGSWNGPIAISGPGLAPVGARLAASQQFGIANQTDVFVVAKDGSARVLWVQGAGTWKGPMAISRANTAPPGAGLAASPQFGVPNQTDVFTVANDGSTGVLWVAGAGTWNGPLPITPTGLAPAGAGLATSQQFGLPNQTDVFEVGADGATRVLWVVGAGTWKGPLPISPKVAPPGAAVAASAQFGLPNQTDVFEVGSDGAYRVVWVIAAGTWNGPLTISRTGLAPAGGGVTASQQFGIPNQTDVFGVGSKGEVDVLWVDGAAGWRGPLAISSTNLAPAGTALAASQQLGAGNQTDVFVVTDNATLVDLDVRGAGTWTGPRVI